MDVDGDGASQQRDLPYATVEVKSEREETPKKKRKSDSAKDIEGKKKVKKVKAGS